MVNGNELVRTWQYFDPQEKLYLDNIFPIIGNTLYQKYWITYKLPVNKKL